MAITNRNIGAITTGTTSVQPSFGVATIQGCLLIAIVGGDSPAKSSCSDSSWICATNGASGTDESEIWYKPYSQASETAPTWSGFTSISYAEISQWQGHDPVPLDQVTSNANILNLQLLAPDATTGDLAISTVKASNSKSATYTDSVTWTPAGGTVFALGDTGATKAAHVFMGSAYVLAANTGGSSGDKGAWTITPSTGLVSGEGSMASFKQFQSPIPPDVIRQSIPFYPTPKQLR